MRIHHAKLLWVTAAIALLAPGCRTVSETGTRATVTPTGPGVSILVLDEVGGVLSGADVWLVEQGALDPVVAALAPRHTGDLVATSRALASASGTSGPDGRAWLPRSAEEGSVLVGAERGALFGQREVDGAAAQDVRVVIKARRELSITVINADGTPVGGVPLTLAMGTPPSGDSSEWTELRQQPVTAVTGASGVATLYVPEALYVSLDRARLAVVARVASARRVVRGLEAAAEADLVLPATVALELFLPRASPELLPWDGFVQVFAAADGSRSDATLAVPVRRGYARVPAVEAGLDLRVNGLLTVPGEGTWAKFSRRVDGEEVVRTMRAQLEIKAGDLQPVPIGAVR